MKKFLIYFGISLSAIAVEVDVVVNFEGSARGLISSTNALSVLNAGTYGWYDGWSSEYSDGKWYVEERPFQLTFPVEITHSNVVYNGEGTNWLNGYWGAGWGSGQQLLRFQFKGGYSGTVATNAIIAGFLQISLNPENKSSDLITLSRPDGSGYGVLNTVLGYVRSHGANASGSSTYGPLISGGGKLLWYNLILVNSFTNTEVKIWDVSSNYYYLGNSQAGNKIATKTWRVTFPAGYIYQYDTNVNIGPFVIKYNPSAQDILDLQPGFKDETYLQAQIDATTNGGILDISEYRYTLDGPVVISNKWLTLKGNANTWITNSVPGALGSGTNIGIQAALRIYANSNGLIRLQDINFTGPDYPNHLHINGDKWAVVHVTRCKFYDSGHSAVTFGGLTSSFLNSNEFINCVSTYGSYAWGVGGADRGWMNYSWTNPLTLGTTNTPVLEYNTIIYNSNALHYDETIGVGMAGLGGRITFRYNKITNYTAAWLRFLDFHGNGNPVDIDIQPSVNGITNSHRGSRQGEVYENTVVNIYDGGMRLSDYRGSTIYTFSNNFLFPSGDYSFYCREEDAPYYFNYLTNYPGYDQHWMYFWDNYANGLLVNTLSHNNYTWDPEFIRININAVFSAPLNYIPLVYPHPLAGGIIPVPPNTNIAAGYLRGVKLSGRYFIQ